MTMPNNEKPAVNPMKDGPEDDENKVVFESEELAKYAADAADEYGLDLGEMVGTGENGVITADDVDKAIEEADEGETVNFASEDAGEFYAENEEAINLDEAEGTGAEGAITVDDLKKVMSPAPADEEAVKFTTDKIKEAADAAVKDHGIDLAKIKGSAKDGSINAQDIRDAIEAVQKSKDPATPSAPEPKDDDAEEEVDEIKAIIDDLVSFGLPVRGTLKSKPQVLERWLDLQSRAVKAQRAF